MIAPLSLLTCVPPALAGHIAKLRVGMTAIALLITTTGSFAPGAYAATKLYSTDFSPAQTTLSSPVISSNGEGARQALTGINAATGAQEPITPWGASTSHMDMGVWAPVTPSTLANYQSNTIQQVTGPNGTPVYALFQNLKVRPDNSSAQDDLLIHNGDGMYDTGDVYYSFWFKFQSDVRNTLGADNWRSFSAWKTGGSTDYRIESFIHLDDATNKLVWRVEAGGWDNSGTKHKYWEQYNTTVAVPVGEWFKYEVFWHRSKDGNGRYWAAVNGQVLVDKRDSLYPTGVSNPQPIDRVFLNLNYGGGSGPLQQWTTGLEIWEGFPCGDGVSCYGGTPATPSTPSTPATPSKPATPSTPVGYTLCANEGQTYGLTVPTDVAYGANGAYAYKYNQLGNVSFTNKTFGDPIPTAYKHGFCKKVTTPIGPRGYRYCAKEDQTVTLQAISDVAYGSNGIFAYLYGLTGSIRFDNDNFGDPIPDGLKNGFCKVI